MCDTPVRAHVHQYKLRNGNDARENGVHAGIGGAVLHRRQQPACLMNGCNLNGAPLGISREGRLGRLSGFKRGVRLAGGGGGDQGSEGVKHGEVVRETMRQRKRESGQTVCGCV